MLNYIKQLFSNKVELSLEEDLIAQNIFYLLPEQGPYTRWHVEQAAAMLADTKIFNTEDIEYVKYLILNNKI